MEERKAFPSLVRALLALALMYFGLNLANILVSLMTPRLSARGIELSPAVLYACSGAAELLFVGVPATMWKRRRERRAAGAVRRDALSAGRTAWVVLAAATCVPTMALLGTLWDRLLETAGIAYSQGMQAPESVSDVIACLLTAAVVAPVCEEEFFRGRLFAALETLGTRRAVTLSTVLFALMHGAIGSLPVHLGIGLILALLLVRTRSISAPILFHACFNGLTVIAASLPDAVPERLTMGLACALIACPFALYGALRPCARMYILPEGRRMSTPAREITVAIIAVFSLPYVFSVIF